MNFEEIKMMIYPSILTNNLDYRPCIYSRTGKTLVRPQEIAGKLGIPIDEYNGLLTKYGALSEGNYYHFKSKVKCNNFINSMEIKKLLRDLEEKRSMTHVFSTVRFGSNSKHGFDNLTVITTTPKEYWEEEGLCYDEHADERISDILEKFGFDEEMESVFSGDLMPDEIIEKLRDYPEFEFDKKFDDFVKASFE